MKEIVFILLSIAKAAIILIGLSIAFKNFKNNGGKSLKAFFLTAISVIGLIVIEFFIP